MVALQEPRRTATLAASSISLEASGLDDAVELFDALMANIFAQAEHAYRKARLRSLRDLDTAAIMLRDVGGYVVTDEDGERSVAEWKRAFALRRTGFQRPNDNRDRTGYVTYQE